jgi:predicted HicB family RNase H-like nuclease
MACVLFFIDRILRKRLTAVRSLRCGGFSSKRDSEGEAVMTYKGYQAIVLLNEEAGAFHGEVINTRDVITFQGSSVEELKQAFQDSVDDYLEFCATRGEDPEKPFSGKVLVRLPPEVHRKIMAEARRQGKSLNAYILEKLQPEPEHQVTR